MEYYFPLGVMAIGLLLMQPRDLYYDPPPPFPYHFFHYTL